jgi:hypothetical protein
MRRVLEIFRQETGEYETNELNELSFPNAAPPQPGRRLNSSKGRCPRYIDSADWERAVEDARKFLSNCDVQPEALPIDSPELRVMDRELKERLDAIDADLSLSARTSGCQLLGLRSAK